MGTEEPIVNQNESFDIQEGVDTILSASGKDESGSLTSGGVVETGVRKQAPVLL